MRIPSFLTFSLLSLGLLLVPLRARGQADFGGYGGVAPKVTRLNEATAFMPGVTFGAILFRNYYVGVELHALLGNIPSDSLTSGGRRPYLEVGTAIARLGYVAMPENLVSPIGAIGFGAGSVSFSGLGDNGPDETQEASYAFWFVEPEIGVDLGISSNVHLDAAVGYRFPFATETGIEPAGDLGGPSLVIRARFGWFGERD